MGPIKHKKHKIDQIFGMCRKLAVFGTIFLEKILITNTGTSELKPLKVSIQKNLHELMNYCRP